MRKIRTTALVATALCAAVGSAQLAGAGTAVTLTASTLNDTLTNINTSTFGTTLLHTASDDIDSLFYLPNGDIVYDLETEQQVRLFDGTNDTLIASHAGWSNQLLDMALDPTQTSFLLSDHDAGTDGGGVYRVTLGGTVTQLVTGVGYQGIAFDPANSANAFYVANDGSGGSHFLDEYSATGTLLSQITLSGSGMINEVDGLTWDPATKELWGALKFGGIAEFMVNPTTFVLTGVQIFQSTAFQNTDVDGITTDGAGNLYVVIRGQTSSPILGPNMVGIYNIATNTLSQGSNQVAGLDDLAPAAGLGSNNPNPVPLPASVWTGLSLLGGLGLVAKLRQRKPAPAMVR